VSALTVSEPTHGLRAYRRGCRCVVCRVENAAYIAAVRRSPRPTVDASPARRHLQQLAALGVGSRQAAQLGRLSRAALVRILTGQQATIYASTAAAVLAIRPVLAHGASVPGVTTWRQIDSLEREGYTRRTLGRLLGSQAQQLQLHRRVRVRSALRVARLYDALASECPA
jgi:hypothetical protein